MKFGVGRVWAALPLIIFALAAGVFYVAVLHGPAVRPSALVGREAPPLNLAALPGIAGPALAGSDLRTGGKTVVNFWASWCLPCRLEHPVLMALAKRSDFTLVGVNYKDDPKLARAYLKDHGDPFVRLGLDLDGRTAIDWGVSGVPETFVVDGSGRILAHHEGPLTQNALKHLGLEAKTSAAGP